MHGQPQATLRAIKSVNLVLGALLQQDIGAITRVTANNRTYRFDPEAMRPLASHSGRLRILQVLKDYIGTPANPLMTPDLVSDPRRLAAHDLFHANRFTIIRAAALYATNHGHPVPRTMARFAAPIRPMTINQ